jgi:hypothetical protein
MAEAMIKIVRDKVDDPLFFMADYLQQKGNEVQAAETEIVYAKFLVAVAEAEVMEREVEAELRLVANQAIQEK